MSDEAIRKQDVSAETGDEVVVKVDDVKVNDIKVDDDKVDDDKVADDVEKAEEPLKGSRRDQVMQSILENRAHQIAEEKAAAGKNTEANAEAEQDDDEIEELEEKEVLPPKTKLKVDGEEIEVDEDKIREAGIRALQKDISGDKKLAVAAEENARLNHRIAELAARTKAIEEAEQKLKKAPSESVVAMVSDYHAAIIDGDDEKAKEIMVNIVSRQAYLEEAVSKLTEDHRRTASEVDRRAKESQTSLVDKFVEKFPDIAKDQTLWNLARENTVLLQEKNPGWSREKVTMEAGKAVMKWWTRGAEKKRDTATRDAATAEEKIKAKQTMVQQPRKAAGQRKAPPPEPKKPTGSDIVAEMRRARGLVAI